MTTKHKMLMKNETKEESKVDISLGDLTACADIHTARPPKMSATSN